MRRKKKLLKSPVLAAILNVAIPGAGYLYLDMKKTFSVLLILAMVVSVFGGTKYLDFSGRSLVSVLLSYLLYVIAFGYDGYKEAVHYNNSKVVKQI